MDVNRQSEQCTKNNKNKAKIKILETKLNAIIKILDKEGIIDEEEFREEFNKLIEENEDSNS